MNHAPAAATMWDEDGNFVFAVRPYYQDTDAGGVVYHTRYIEFAERARSEMLRALGQPTVQLAAVAGVIFAVHSLHARWHASARLEDALAVHTHVPALTPVRLTCAQSLRRGDVLLMELSVVLVCLHQARATRIPAPLVRALVSRWPALAAPSLVKGDQ